MNAMPLVEKVQTPHGLKLAYEMSLLVARGPLKNGAAKKLELPVSWPRKASISPNSLVTERIRLRKFLLTLTFPVLAWESADPKLPTFATAKYKHVARLMTLAI